MSFGFFELPFDGSIVTVGSQDIGICANVHRIATRPRLPNRRMTETLPVSNWPSKHRQNVKIQALNRKNPTPPEKYLTSEKAGCNPLAHQ
jgi:hypothetical protein